MNFMVGNLDNSLFLKPMSPSFCPNEEGRSLENESFVSSTQAELNKWANRVTNGMIPEFTIPDS